MRYIKKFNEGMNFDKYNQLAPDKIVDVFYDKIKDSIDNSEDCTALVNNLIKINGKVPDFIQALINKKDKK